VLHPYRVNTEILRLGSDYGGWKVVPPRIESETIEILSFGLGEDASFDIEVCELFNSRVHICDPTPRAISHFNDICNSFGLPKTTAYSDIGRQVVTSYPLSRLNSSLLLFYPIAIWNQTGILRLYLPLRKESVSMSINLKKSQMNESSRFLDVNSMRVVELVSSLGITKIELVKIDIEGAELEVIKDMLSSKVFPRQILVEFDFLLTPRISSLSNLIRVMNLLWKSGYRMSGYDFPRNFSFIRLETWK
jgi:hypothetical protein